MVAQPKTRLTVAEFYELPEYEAETHLELINGEVVYNVGAIPKHQDIVGAIYVYLWFYVSQQGGRTFQAPIEIQLDAENHFEPDVLYLKPGSKCIVTEKRLEGAPDLVVEVLSPSSAKRDRQEKFEAYQRNGVQEYWIADPAHETLEVWTLNNGQFKRLGAYAHGDTFQSPLLGQPVPLDNFFPQPTAT